MKTPPPLTCPGDSAQLARTVDSSHYSCPTCRRAFPIEGGVVRFLERDDRFYEGRYLHTTRFTPRSERWFHSWPLWLVNSGFVWAVREHVRADETVVELGCGSGVTYFAQRFCVVGLDLSFSSLARVASFYDACVQADAVEGIPLPSDSVDAVISSFVWEHIEPSLKPKLLGELRRILRPRGRLVFLYDVEPQNPFFRRMRARDPALYREVLIDSDGHLGWQGERENRDLFEAHGFFVRSHRGKQKLLFGPDIYDKMQRFGGGMALLAAIGLRFRGGWRFHPYNALLRVFDETAGRLLPLSWSRIVITVCEKRDEGTGGSRLTAGSMPSRAPSGDPTSRRR